VKIVKLALAGVAALAVLGPAPSSIAEPPKPARVVIPPWPDPGTLPRFDVEPFSDEHSKPPTAREWQDAPQVQPSRAAASTTRTCRVYRVREWLKIHCERRTATLRLLAGSADGVAMFIPDPPKGPNDSFDPFERVGVFGEVIFPIRRGDGRLFEWIDFDFGEYEGWGVTSAFVIEEAWPEGAKAPVVALRAR
jgi:hypothetical protein